MVEQIGKINISSLLPISKNLVMIDKTWLKTRNRSDVTDCKAFDRLCSTSITGRLSPW